MGSRVDFWSDRSGCGVVRSGCGVGSWSDRPLWGSTFGPICQNYWFFRGGGATIRHFGGEKLDF